MMKEPKDAHEGRMLISLTYEAIWIGLTNAVPTLNCDTSTTCNLDNIQWADGQTFNGNVSSHYEKLVFWPNQHLGTMFKKNYPGPLAIWGRATSMKRPTFCALVDTKVCRCSPPPSGTIIGGLTSDLRQSIGASYV